MKYVGKCAILLLNGIVLNASLTRQGDFVRTDSSTINHGWRTANDDASLATHCLHFMT